MSRKYNGKILRRSGLTFSILGILILLIGYFIKESLVIREIQVNFIPFGWITLIIGGLILLFYYLSRISRD